jgi:hypothetical protein
VAYLLQQFILRFTQVSYLITPNDRFNSHYQTIFDLYHHVLLTSANLYGAPQSSHHPPYLILSIIFREHKGRQWEDPDGGKPTLISAGELLTFLKVLNLDRSQQHRPTAWYYKKPGRLSSL